MEVNLEESRLSRKRADFLGLTADHMRTARGAVPTEFGDGNARRSSCTHYDS